MTQIHVYRCGETQERMDREDRPNGEIYAGYPHNQDKPSGGITVRFGLGPDTRRSKVWVWLGSEEFEFLARAMMDSDAPAARKAFLEAMLDDEIENPKRR